MICVTDGAQIAQGPYSLSFLTIPRSYLLNVACGSRKRRSLMRLTLFILRFRSKSPTNQEKLSSLHRVSASMISVATFTIGLMLCVPQAQPQDAELQKRVTEIKEYLALNKMVLARYTWQESQTVSVKG